MKKLTFIGSIFLLILFAGAGYQYHHHLQLTDPVTQIRLLQEKQFDVLNDIFAEKIADLEQDISKEIPLETAILALANDDPAHETLLNEWAALFPDNPIPYMVRGIYYVSLGNSWRGTAYARKTSDKQFDRMEVYYKKAFADLMKALSLNPKLTVAYSGAISIAPSVGIPRETIVSEALKAEPASYLIRKSYFFKLMPRWGGSYEEIEAFIHDTEKYVSVNPELKPLLGFKDYVKGYNYDCDCEGDAIYQQAIAAYTRALSYGEKSWYYSKRGIAYYEIEDYENALKDLNRALALYPGMADALLWRGTILEKLEKSDEAMVDYNLALILEPYDYSLNMRRGRLFQLAENYPKAIEDYQRSLYFNKRREYIWRNLGWIYNYKLKDYPKSRDAYRNALRMNPTDPTYWHIYSVVLDSLLDCEIISAMHYHKTLCELQTDDPDCGAEFINWDVEVTKQLVGANKCPAFEEMTDYFIPMDSEIAWVD